MRIYFDVKLSTPQPTIFLPTALFFAPEDYEGETDVPSKDIVKLECIECESAPFNGIPDKEFGIRWKGVTMETDKDYDEDFTLDDLKAAIAGKRLCNMEANLDHDTVVQFVAGVTVEYMNERFDIPKKSIDEIYFDGIDYTERKLNMGYTIVIIQMKDSQIGEINEQKYQAHCSPIKLNTKYIRETLLTAEQILDLFDDTKTKDNCIVAMIDGMWEKHQKRLNIDEAEKMYEICLNGRTIDTLVNIHNKLATAVPSLCLSPYMETPTDVSFSFDAQKS